MDRGLSPFGMLWVTEKPWLDVGGCCGEEYCGVHDDGEAVVT